MRELRRHQRESPISPFVFVSELGAPLSAPGFSRMVERAATAADHGIKAHAHMLRHARDPGLSRAPQYSEYDALYRLGAAAVQGVFSRLDWSRIRRY
jgi:hypothetical protein